MMPIPFPAELAPKPLGAALLACHKPKKVRDRSKEKRKPRVADPYSETKLAKQRGQIMAHLRKHKTATRAELMAITGLGLEQYKTCMEVLTKKRLAVFVGHGPRGHWEAA